MIEHDIYLAQSNNQLQMSISEQITNSTKQNYDSPFFLSFHIHNPILYVLALCENFKCSRDNSYNYRRKKKLKPTWHHRSNELELEVWRLFLHDLFSSLCVVVATLTKVRRSSREKNSTTSFPVLLCRIHPIN